jgi:hypothetical protein
MSRETAWGDVAEMARSRCLSSFLGQKLLKPRDRARCAQNTEPTARAT